MGKRIRRKTMSTSNQNNTENQDQQLQQVAEAPAQGQNSEQEEISSTGWFASWWRIIAVTLVAVIVTLTVFFGVLQSAENRAYNTGYKAGVEYTISTYENTPWYSRWWSGITGTFPGKK